MNAGMQAVIDALDAVDAPVNFFLRDDDAGWHDERLFALLDCTARAGVPIDLAVIPQATGFHFAAELSARFDDANGLIGLHQHGYAHENHETTGRKCEFGPMRELAAQRHDLIAGRERLRTLFGARLDDFFTPPWNRCSAETPSLLAQLGYTGLSRDASAPAQTALAELRVDVDWCKQQRLATERGEATGEAIACELARHIGSGVTVGLMLHHGEMSDTELDWLEAWLTCWSRHPNARWQPMRALFGRRSDASAIGAHSIAGEITNSSTGAASRAFSA
jgi:hypothetical protein